MSEVFISYRRDDSSDVTGRIYDHLTARFGQAQIFKDVESIQLGADFRDIISNAVAQCNVLLVIIGDNWLTVTDESGARRIDSVNDYVNLEIKTALTRDIAVIPVLVGGASMPAESDLPESLRDLAFRNVIQVRPDPDFRNDIVRLSDRLAEQIESGSKRGAITGPLALLFKPKLIAGLVAIAAIIGLFVFMEQRPAPEPVGRTVTAASIGSEPTTEPVEAEVPAEDISAASVTETDDDADFSAEGPNSVTAPEIVDPVASTRLSAVVLSGAKELANKTKVAEKQD